MIKSDNKLFSILNNFNDSEDVSNSKNVEKIKVKYYLSNIFLDTSLFRKG
jgi:hypothetical protein